MKYPEPEIKGLTYIYNLTEQKLFVSVSRLKDRGNSVHAEFVIRTTNPDYDPFLLQQTVNLLDGRKQVEVANNLARAYPKQKIDYINLIKYICAKTLAAYREGEQIVDITGGDGKTTSPRPQFLIEPLAYEGLPNVLYGEGSSAKSSLAIACCVLVAHEYDGNPMKLKVKKSKSLYLDWELENQLAEYNLDRIVQGFGLDATTVKYRRCGLPLVDDFVRIEKAVSENDIGFVVIDSLASAAGSDNLKEAQAATDFYNALRQLKVTSLIVAHPTKNEGGLYGSVFFFNLARNIWEVRRSQQQDENSMEIALIHKKNNLGALRSPLGFRFTFSDERIMIDTSDVKGSFYSLMPLKTQILDALKAHGMMGPKEIAQEIEANEGSVRNTIKRLYKDEKVIYLQGKYGAAADRE